MTKKNTHDNHCQICRWLTCGWRGPATVSRPCQEASWGPQPPTRPIRHGTKQELGTLPGHHVTPFRPANGMQQPHILLNTNNGMQVAEVRVEGPRYWQQTLSGSFLGPTAPYQTH